MGEKIKNAKVVAMEQKVRPINTKPAPEYNPEKPKEVSYDQLKAALSQYEQRLERALMENQALRQEQAIIRINFLFEIIRNKEMFSLGVVEKAVLEIEGVIYPEPYLKSGEQE